MNKEEAIKIVKSHYPANKQMLNEALEFLIPELKKKTDEEMIQKLIAVVHLYYGEGVDAERDECLEWLEKQAKQKHIERKEFTSIPFGAFDSELIEQMFTIPDGCVATIEGNKIHIKREYKTATEAIKEEKVDNTNNVEPKFHEDEIRLWTLSDAKAGNVLVSSIDKPFIYNGCYNKYEVGAYCGLNINNEFTIAYKQYYWTNNDSIRPATKEERKTLFNEMNLLGWIWNPETKELNRIDKNNENNN